MFNTQEDFNCFFIYSLKSEILRQKAESDNLTFNLCTIHYYDSDDEKTRFDNFLNRVKEATGRELKFSLSEVEDDVFTTLVVTTDNLIESCRQIWAYEKGFDIRLKKDRYDINEYLGGEFEFIDMPYDEALQKIADYQAGDTRKYYLNLVEHEYEANLAEMPEGYDVVEASDMTPYDFVRERDVYIYFRNSYYTEYMPLESMVQRLNHEADKTFPDYAWQSYPIWDGEKLVVIRNTAFSRGKYSELADTLQLALDGDKEWYDKLTDNFEVYGAIIYPTK